jgi:RNA polymerase sigma-70 factor (ECF subfamily)
VDVRVVANPERFARGEAAPVPLFHCRPDRPMTPSAPSSEDSTARPDPPSCADDEPALDALRGQLGRGDEAAFERIFRRLSEPVFRFVCGMTQDEALAHDITQDTFAKLWSIRDRMDAVDSLRAYVFQMARNRVYNHQRDQQVRRDNEEHLRDAHPDASPPSPDKTLDADMLRSLLEQWIGELPDRQREALALRRQENLTHDEIAEIMDISPNTVNNHIVRAMKALRSRLRERRPDLLA